MNYPVPTNNKLFEFQEKLKPININDKQKRSDSSNNNQTTQTNIEFSRNKKNKFLDNFINIINKHGNLYKSLPFIKEIYLCNSITFNALKGDSDIDLFIIVKKGYMRRARFFSALFFKINGLKRSINNKKQKFCLSFYITQNNKNLYPIMIDKTDIYLSYWLAHLVPLYKDEDNRSQNNNNIKDNHNIYLNNKRFKSLMPNHPQKHCIIIGNKLFTGKNKIKKKLEFWFGGISGRLIEFMIKIIWLPILLYKIKKLGETGKDIIISNNMLKFHNDIRKQIHLIYKIAKK